MYYLLMTISMATGQNGLFQNGDYLPVQAKVAFFDSQKWCEANADKLRISFKDRQFECFLEKENPDAR